MRSSRVEDVDESDGHDEDEVTDADQEEGERHLGLAGLQHPTGLYAENHVAIVGCNEIYEFAFY